MNKGIIIMVLAGFGFMYLVTNLVNKAESTNPGLENTQSRKAKEYAKYYSEDINGDAVLNLSAVPMKKAKEIWISGPIYSEIISKLPDFDAANQIVKGQLVDSQFKTYLLENLKKIERKYIGGEMNLDQVKKAFADLGK